MTILTTLPDFDELLRLARQAPQQLENLQQQLNAELLQAQSSAESRLVLERLLFRLQSQQRHCVSPLIRLQRTYELMLGHISLMQRQLKSLNEGPESRNQTAQILNFPSRLLFSEQEK